MHRVADEVLVIEPVVQRLIDAGVVAVCERRGCPGVETGYRLAWVLGIQQLWPDGGDDCAEFDDEGVSRYVGADVAPASAMS